MNRECGGNWKFHWWIAQQSMLNARSETEPENKRLIQEWKTQESLPGIQYLPIPEFSDGRLCILELLLNYKKQKGERVWKLLLRPLEIYNIVKEWEKPYWTCRHGAFRITNTATLTFDHGNLINLSLSDQCLCQILRIILKGLQWNCTHTVSMKCTDGWMNSWKRLCFLFSLFHSFLLVFITVTIVPIIVGVTLFILVSVAT